MTPLDPIKERLEGHLLSVVGAVFEALEGVAADLDKREASILEREQNLSLALLEVESLLDDLKATDPSSSYECLPTYEVEGNKYVLADDMAARERQILATLQKIAVQDEQGRWVVSGVSNKQVSQMASPHHPIPASSVSSALTRMARKGLVDTQSLSGRGYPRRILLKARLENPDQFTHDTG